MTAAIGLTQERGWFDVLDDWLKRDRPFSVTTAKKRLSEDLPLLRLTRTARAYGAGRNLASTVSTGGAGRSRDKSRGPLRLRSKRFCMHKTLHLP